MNASPEQVIRLKRQLEDIMKQLKGLSTGNGTESHQSACISQCQECLSLVPATETPVYIHIIGTDKSFKTSYLLDLFDNDELRDIFRIKERNTSENTAVPCLVEPYDDIDNIQMDQVSITTGNVIMKNLDHEQFAQRYDLAAGAAPDDYLIHIRIPKNKTPMDIPVIEYPGIKEGADAKQSQRQLHQAFQDNMMDCLVRFPGIFVACFQHKVSIPLGHPMDAVLKKYGEMLKTDYAHEKLPLVISLQGETAIAGYCGNTNVLEDLANDFQSYKNFDAVVQLVNPSNGQYPVNFVKPGPHVEKWIEQISRYTGVEQIKDQILRDGGISWSRNLLKNICTTSHINQALYNLFFMPWIADAEKTFSRAAECFHTIKSRDEVSTLKEKMRQAILNQTYQSLDDIFETKFAPIRTEADQSQHDGIIEEIVEDQGPFWTSIFSQYLEQFFEDRQRVANIAKGMWLALHQRLDPSNRGFLGARTSDIPLIILNMARLYVPNCLMRGDYYIHLKTTSDNGGQYV